MPPARFLSAWQPSCFKRVRLEGRSTLPGPDRGHSGSNWPRTWTAPFVAMNSSMQVH